MKRVGLICGLACAPISAAAYVDFVCELEGGTDTFVIDLSGQTITQSGFDPLPFEDASLNAFPLVKTMTAKRVGRVDIPLPDHIVPGGFTGFALAEGVNGELLLFENFTDPTARAFASVARIMERSNGIPCMSAEAD